MSLYQWHRRRVRALVTCIKSTPIVSATWLFQLGTWCSGITPAQHAGGPGLNPQCVHFTSAHACGSGGLPLAGTCVLAGRE